MKKTIKDFDLNNKKVIIRCDFNVPINNGKITDDNRIVESIPTIKYALDNNAKVILMSHLGKVKTEEDKIKNTLKPVAERLSELLNKKVTFINETRGEKLEKAINKMKEKSIILIENTRFEDLDGKKESSNDEELGKYWASLGDIYLNDAFGTAHRTHASNVGIASYIESGIGFLIEKELEILEPAINKPQKPFIAILGGAKVADKIKVIENLVEIADYILIGGGMCNTFLKAEGYNVGNSLIDNDSLGFCKDILNKHANKIVLPVDLVVNDEFKDTKGKIKSINEIEDEEIGMDIGPNTVELFKKYIGDAKQIIWNGPMGVFEFKNYQKGTKEICDAVACNTGNTIIGGGDSAAAVIKFGYKDKVTHISTGGGASLALFEGTILPGIDVIPEGQDDVKNIKKKNYLILLSIILIVLYFSLKDNFSLVVKEIISLNKLYVFLALIFMAIYGLLRSLSLHTIIKDFKKDFKFKDTIKNMLITQFFNGTTPFASGGQPVQIYHLKTQGVNLPTSTSIVIQNFVIYQLILLIYGTLAITLNFFFDFFPKNPILKNFIVLGFIVNSAVMVLLFLISYAKKQNKFVAGKIVSVLHKLKLVKYKIKTTNKLKQTVDKFYNSAKKIRKNKKTFIKCFMYNFLAFPFLYSIPLILLYSTGDFSSLNFITSLVACSYVMIIGSFVPIPGGTGGLEFAFVQFYGNYISGHILSTVMIMWRFITYYLGMILGTIALGVNKRR